MFTFRCSNCAWKYCNNSCLESNNHKILCSHLCRIKDKKTFYSVCEGKKDFGSKLIATLKAACLKSTNPETFRVLMKLQTNKTKM